MFRQLLVDASLPSGKAMYNTLLRILTWIRAAVLRLRRHLGILAFQAILCRLCNAIFSMFKLSHLSS
jgi:hypothetical protein